MKKSPRSKPNSTATRLWNDACGYRSTKRTHRKGTIPARIPSDACWSKEIVGSDDETLGGTTQGCCEEVAQFSQVAATHTIPPCRVRPLHFGQDTGDVDDLLSVVLSLKSVVRKKRKRKGKNT